MEQGTMPARIQPNMPARNSRPNGYAIITRSPREQSFSISIFATAGEGEGQSLLWLQESRGPHYRP
eukprot:scaffold37406_cov58-Phaeocystis_antarctica.AAC.2